MALTKVSRGLLSTGIVDNSNATAITIDSSENVGIGTNSPSSYFPGATNLVIAGSGDSGLTVASGTSSMARLLFADGTSGDDRYRGYIAYSHASNTMSFATNATERMHISSAGVTTVANGLTLTDGNVVVAAGHGIDFSAQTATSASGSSTTAELLDHYEEGTWTPYWSDVSANAIFSATTVESARYTKIGRLVSASCYITTPAGFSTTSAYSAGGQIYVAGLPFASSGSGSDYQAVTIGYYSGWQGFAPPKAPVGWTNNAATNIVLYHSGSSTGSVAALPHSTVNAAGAAIILTVTYQTNA
jgi:hypothetical protein